MSAVISGYLIASGIIVALQATCFGALLVALAVAARRERRQLGDDTMNMLRGWTDEDEQWLKRLKGGDQR